MINITFDVLKVWETSGRIGSQPAIKYDQPSEDTKEQHGFFNAQNHVTKRGYDDNQ